MEIRNETPMVNNCAQTILRAYADELGITGDMAAKLSANFGGGMKCGSTCGAITGGLMVLGALGVENPYVINQFRRRIADNHNGMNRLCRSVKSKCPKGRNQERALRRHDQRWL